MRCPILIPVIHPTNPPRVIFAQSEDSAVINHPAMRITHRRIQDLAIRHFLDVVGEHILAQRLGIGAGTAVSYTHLTLPTKWIV